VTAVQGLSQEMNTLLLRVSIFYSSVNALGC
jgi:hypothetical protein